MRQLVIGLGEVGSAIQSILQCDGWDQRDIPEGKALPPEADVLHICFPFSTTFEYDVKAYIEQTGANLVIVHSSVPVGTCDLQGWVHSPVRGVHPNLELGIRTFVKYFGGEDIKAVYAAAEPFRAQGIQCYEVKNARTTEALKLWDTTQYGLMIMIQKMIYAYCLNKGLDPEIVYTDANHTYDIGYEALGRPEVARPYLKFMPGPIGGHCVIPNAKILVETTEDMQLELVRELLEGNYELIEKYAKDE